MTYSPIQNYSSAKMFDYSQIPTADHTLMDETTYRCTSIKLMEMGNGILLSGSLSNKYGIGNNIKLWDINKAKLLKTVKAEGNKKYSTVIPWGNNQIVVVYNIEIPKSKNCDNYIGLLDVNIGEFITTIHLGIKPQSQYTKYVACGNGVLASAPHYNRDYGSIILIDLNSHKHVGFLEMGWSITALAPLENNLLVSASYDNVIKIWDLISEKCIQTLRGHSATVWHLAVSGNGALASSSNDRTIKLWDMHMGKCLHTQQVNRPSLITAWRNGGLAYIDYDNENIHLEHFYLCDANFSKSMKIQNEHKYSIHDLVMLENGMLATASNDKTIKLWQFPTRQFNLQDEENYREEIRKNNFDRSFAMLKLACKKFNPDPRTTEKEIKTTKQKYERAKKKSDADYSSERYSWCWENLVPTIEEREKLRSEVKMNKPLFNKEAQDFSKIDEEFKKIEKEAFRLQSAPFYLTRAEFYQDTAKAMQDARPKRILSEKSIADYEQALRFAPFTEGVTKKIEAIEAELRMQITTSQESQSSSPTSLPTINMLTSEQQAKVEAMKQQILKSLNS